MFTAVYYCCNTVRTTANITVGISNVHPLDTNPELGSYDVCGQHPGTVSQGDTVSVPCSEPYQYRRYVIVQIPATSYINFCEVEVYASQG